MSKKNQSGADSPAPRPRVPALRVGAALVVLLCVLLSACSGDESVPDPAVDAAEAQWRAQAIDSYTIEVQAISSIWHLQTQTIEIRDGVVTDSSARCDPAPAEIDGCEVIDFDPADFTVEGLFARARAEAERDAEYLTITFDETYGYPTSIGYNHPDILDEDWALSVTAFQPLP